MTFALLERAAQPGAARVVALSEQAFTGLPDGLSGLDLSGVVPIPGLGWMTADDGKTFTDPHAPTLDGAQGFQAAELRADCAAAIMAGFSSSALGAPHTYPSDDHSQRNLQAARGLIGGNAALLMCGDADGAWSLREHTAAQTEQVNLDWVAFRQSMQQQLETRLASLAAATTPDAALAVAWFE